MGTPLVKLAIGIGGMLISAALAPKPKPQYGPRLADINVMSVSPGNPIVRHWGTMKLPSQLLWTSKIMETEHVESAGGKGKGGGGKGGSQKIYTYTYSVHCAMGICAGPIERVNRIWANQKLLWVHPDVQKTAQRDFDAAYYAELDRLINQEGVQRTDEAYCGAFFFAFNNYRIDEYTLGTEAEALNYIMSHPAVPPHVQPAAPAPNRGEVSYLLGKMLSGMDKDSKYSKLKIRFDGMYIYLGSEEQQPDALLTGALGVGNAPAFRGTAYFVLNNLQLEDFGNSVPTFTVEVMKTDGDVDLTTIINDVCLESGLDKDEFDGVGRMESNKMLKGYAVTQAASARQILNDLQTIYPFEGAESAYRLVFNWINVRPRAIIRREDFAAHEVGSDQPPRVEITRAHDSDMPQRLNLRFQEPSRSYSPNNVFAQRTETESTTVDDIDITVALTREMAKTQAEEMLALKFTARKSYKVVLPSKYVLIEPGDPILVLDDMNTQHGNTYVSWRCTECTIGVAGLIEFTFVDHNYNSGARASTDADLVNDDNRPDEMEQSSPTTAYMLDTPLLADNATDDIGFYTVLTGSRRGWDGGSLLIDTSSGGVFEAFGVEQDNETTGSAWYILRQSQARIAHGFTLTPLPRAIPAVWDYASKIRILLMDTSITLSSIDQGDAMGAPINTAMIGDEIVQFCNAVDLGNGIWELSVFMRGMRGTDYAIEGHASGERFVRLQNAATSRVTHAVEQLYQTHDYKSVSFGDSSDNSDSFVFANTGNSLRPFTASITLAVKRSDGTFDFAWMPRVRLNGQLTNALETVLDQDIESYEIDVLSAGAVIKTYAVGDLRSWSYTQTMQNTDFGAAQDKITCNLYQMGNIIGRGFASKLEA